MNYIGKFIVSVALMIGSLFGYHQQSPTLFGDTYNPAGAGTYRLQSSIGATDTSLTLSSFKEPVSSLPYTMAYLNSTLEYATLEPSNNTSKEFISFTGITQNADGTATISGITRGLSFAFPYTASTTFQQAHSGQSIFILSNPPQLTNMYANKTNNESITGLWNFATAPIDNGTSTSTLQFATRGYANSLAIQGAATSSYNTGGIGLLATGLQAANGQYSLNSPYFLSGAISSSTYVGGASNKVIITGSQNTIDSNFIATSSAYTWSGNNTFSGLTKFTGTGTTTASNGIESNLAIAAPYFNATSTTATSTLTALRVSGSATTTNLTVSGTCIGCSANGYEIITSTGTGPTTQYASGSATASCSAGKKVVGGGSSLSGGGGASVVLQSFPASNTSWQADYSAVVNTSANTITVYAICVNK